MSLLTLIVNPTAGNGYALKMEEPIRQELEKRGVAHTILRTEYPGHATALAREAAQRTDCTGVVSVGGDGTAFEVACGLMGTGAPLGVIPAGTGNDFVKTVGIPRKPMAALEKILSGAPRPVDVGSMNDRLFLNVCGTGFDVTVLDYTVAAKKYVRGILPYLVGLVRAIVHYRPVHVRMEVDGQVQERDVLVCSVANGRFIGGGIPICPEAAPDDGLMDLVVVETRPRWMIPFYLPGLLMGKVLSFGVTTHCRCQRVELVSPGMRLNVDGEILSLDAASFAIQPGRLMLYW
ncbi:MAG: diacylglycerol/lipid kinase family protein [Aristaeellaceae bacterium]